MIAIISVRGGLECLLGKNSKDELLIGYTII